VRPARRIPALHQIALGAEPASSTGQPSRALTPGVYSIPSTITVTRPDTQIVGLGFATLVPSAGNTTLSVADVSGVTVSGLLFDAGSTT
jgi:hypothetical protein